MEGYLELNEEVVAVVHAALLRAEDERPGDTIHAACSVVDDLLADEALAKLRALGAAEASTRN